VTILRDVLSAHEKVPHRSHQLEGVEQLVALTDPTRGISTWTPGGRSIPGVFVLFDEVGAGKTKQVIDAAQILWTGLGEIAPRTIDTVVVIAPGYARSTWADEDPVLGEVAKHAWDMVPNVIHEYHKHYDTLRFHPNALNWVVSNYEFIRRDQRRNDLIRQLRGRRTWLVLDESWSVQGASDQMRACRLLRVRRADRVTELNGTPLSDGKPENLYYPAMIGDPDILGVRTRTEFRAKFCIMGGYMNKKAIAYQNLDEFNARLAPYILSRRTRDCFDLPPMLDPIIVEARLTPATWALYTQQRDDMVTWLGSQVSISKHAIVKMLRLTQITSGFLGGLEEMLPDAPVAAPTDPMPQWLRTATGLVEDAPPPMSSGPGPSTREIGREKLDATLHWLDTFATPPHKLLVWCKFTAELERMTRALEKIYPVVANLRGGQSAEDREAAKALLAPNGDPRQGAVVGNPKAGGASLNFSAANIAVYVSRGPALIERTQTIGRIERPGATQPMLIVDVVATGPRGQKTVDHGMLKALRNKEDMARWTVAQWRALLTAS
jgi:hypothetical protein